MDKTAQKIRRKDDMLLKSAFEEAFPDLLRFYFKEADDIFDMDRGFQFMDKELGELFPEMEKAGGHREVDMLVKAFRKNGEEKWILLHVEIQGGSTKDFAHRMLVYWYRLYDRYGVNITALVVFTGNEKQKRPNHFHQSFLGTEITYKYNAYHILDHSEAELLAMPNPFSLIVLTAQKALLMGKIPEEELEKERLTIARAMIASKAYSHDKIVKFLYFIRNFLHIRNPEINRNFDEEINKLTGREDTMGIIETIKYITREEGREEGIEKGIEIKTRETVTALIEKLGLDDDMVAAVAKVSVAYVQQIRKEISA